MQNPLRSILSCTAFIALLTLGCSRNQSPNTLFPTPASSSIGFHIASDSSVKGMAVQKVSEDIAGNRLNVLYLAEKPFLTGEDVTSVKVGLSEQGSYILLFELTTKGREALLDASIKAQGKRIAILHEGNVVRAPYVSSPIISQFLKVTGFSSREECENTQKILTKSISSK